MGSLMPSNLTALGRGIDESKKNLTPHVVVVKNDAGRAEDPHPALELNRLQLPHMSRLRRHGVHLPVRLFIIANLKGEPRKEADLDVLERVNNAAFANVQMSTRPTAMFGPYTWRWRRRAGVYRRRGPATPRSGREALRSWGIGAPGMPGHSHAV